MLAVLGFSVAAIILFLYAATFEKLIVDKLRLAVRDYSAAYYLLAGTFFLWAVASTSQDDTLLQSAVIVGDTLLVVASILLLRFIVPARFNNFAVGLGILLGAVITYLRISSYESSAYFQDGVAVLNTSRPIIIIVGIILAIVWLPAAVKVLRQISYVKPIPNLFNFLIPVYVMSIFSTLLYVSAQRPTVVILSFTLIILGATAMLLSNFYVDTYTITTPTKRKTKKSGK